MIKTRSNSEVSIFEILKNTNGEVELSGRILRNTLAHINKSYARNRRQIIINLEGVAHISDRALTALLTKRDYKDGLVLCFYGMSPKLKHAMHHSGFLSAFSKTIFDSEKEALAYLRTTSTTK